VANALSSRNACSQYSSSFSFSFLFLFLYAHDGNDVVARFPCEIEGERTT
jgi:hypothetical protein